MLGGLLGQPLLLSINENETVKVMTPFYKGLNKYKNYYYLEFITKPCDDCKDMNVIITIRLFVDKQDHDYLINFRIYTQASIQSQISCNIEGLKGRSICQIMKKWCFREFDCRNFLSNLSRPVFALIEKINFRTTIRLKSYKYWKEST